MIAAITPEFTKPINWSCLVGKTIVSAVSGTDNAGYDVLIITLDDGTIFAAEERGQCGEIEYTLTSEGNIT